MLQWERAVQPCGEDDVHTWRAMVRVCACVKHVRDRFSFDGARGEGGREGARTDDTTTNKNQGGNQTKPEPTQTTQKHSHTLTHKNTHTHRHTQTQTHTRETVLKKLKNN